VTVVQSNATSLNVGDGAGFFSRQSERRAEYSQLTGECEGRCEEEAPRPTMSYGISRFHLRLKVP